MLCIEHLGILLTIQVRHGAVVKVMDKACEWVLITVLDDEDVANTNVAMEDLSVLAS